ncbi:predicted protein [Chaetoceros tenuissimus]|uniref:Uncharacterized protein n=1 Tax=Chaetoceros tenuissimus TaxID=426638 RepID=A0AAD3CRA8_9STRA|nr:predicted protein [Chaetoceros tenuissimus]
MSHPSNNNYPWNGHEYQQPQENNQESYQQSNPNDYYYNQGLGLLQQNDIRNINTFQIQPMTMQPPTGNPFQFAGNSSNNTQAQLRPTSNPFYFGNNNSSIQAQVPPPPIPGNAYNSMAVQQNQHVCPPPPPFPPAQVYPPPPPPVFSKSENVLPPPPLPKKKKSQQKVKQTQTLKKKKKKKKGKPAPAPLPPQPPPQPSKKKRRKKSKAPRPAPPALLPRPAPPVPTSDLHSVDESKLPPPPQPHDTSNVYNEINTSGFVNEEHDKKEPIHHDSTQANSSQNDMDMDISDESDNESNHELTHKEEEAVNDTNVEKELQNRKEYLKLKRKKVKLQKIKAKLDEAKMKREVSLKNNSRHGHDEIVVKEEENVSALEQKRLRLEAIKAKLNEAKMNREVVLKSSNSESTDKEVDEKEEEETISDLEQKKIRLEAMKAKLNEAKLRKAEGSKRQKSNEVDQAELDKKRLKLEQMRARLLWKKEQASRQSSDAGSEPDMSTFAENVQEDESIIQQETNYIGDENESGLHDITAFSMTSLVISNISAGGETELVRPRAIESINILGPPRTSTRTNNMSMEMKVKEEPVAESKTEEKSDVSRADKLKLELELAKRRLRLVELQRKRQKIAETFEENDSGTVKKESASKGDKLSKPSIEELLKKRQELSDNIQASKITQQKKKEESTVRQLRTMIAKQEKLLNQHKDAVKQCIIDIQDCRTTIENEKAVKEKAELQLRDLQQRRENTEKMMKDVSNNVMKLRSKRS